jgi:hypothetical protein
MISTIPATVAFASGVVLLVLLSTIFLCVGRKSRKASLDGTPEGRNQKRMEEEKRERSRIISGYQLDMLYRDCSLQVKQSSRLNVF